MVKRLSSFLLTVVCVLTVTACSSSDNRTAASSAGDFADYQMNEIVAETTGYKKANFALNGDTGYTAAPTAYEQDGNTIAGTIPDTPVEKKIIRNANLSLETANVEEAYQKLLDYVKSFGGYEFNKDMNKREDYTSLSATLKVQPDKLDSVLNYAAECGEVKYVNTTSDDITSEYYDIELRLQNKRKNLDKYYDYLQEARNVEELIMLQNEIDRLTAEIESYEGTLKLWNTKTSESEIYISIYQKGDPVQLKEVDWSAMSLSEMLISMGNGFKSACNVVLGFFQWLIIVVITILPVIVVLSVVSVPLVLIVKKKRKNKNELNKDKNKD